MSGTIRKTYPVGIPADGIITHCHIVSCTIDPPGFPDPRGGTRLAQNPQREEREPAMSRHERLEQIRWFFRRKYKIVFLTLSVFAAMC